MKARYALGLGLIASATLNAQVFDWAGQMGYNGNQDGRAIIVDLQGNVYHSGFFIDGIDLDPGPGTDIVSGAGQDGYLIKQANDGTYLWGARLTGNCLPNALAFTSDGDILVVGTFMGTVDFDPGPGVANMTAPASLWYFVCSYSPDGTYQWAKKFGCNQPVYEPAVAVDASGNIHLTGTFTQTMDADPGDGTGEVYNMTSAGINDVFITTLDAQGAFVRAMSFGDTGDDRGVGIAADPDGNVYVTGYFAGDIVIEPNGANIALTNNSSSYNEVYVLKMNAAGAVQWAKSFGGQWYDEGRCITVNAAQEVFVGGRACTSADLDPGPGAFINPGSDAAFYLKLDAAGDFVQAALSYYTNLSDARSDAIAVDASGRIYITGHFNGYAVDFDPGAGATNYDSNGNSWDGFISVYSADGEYLWSRQLGSLGTGQEWVQGLAVDAAGSCYMTGSFGAAMDFDPGAGEFILTPIAAGYYDAFVLKLDPADLGMHERGNAIGLSAYPVPTEGLLNIVLNEPVRCATLRVLDISGKVVLTRSGIVGNRIALDLSALRSGAYTVELTNGGSILRKAIVKD